jgi:leucyl aminopeptidase
LDKGKKYGFENTLAEACEIEGLGAFFSCWKGSQNEPQFVVMTYTQRNGSSLHVGLVGKGITLILEV